MTVIGIDATRTNSGGAQVVLQRLLEDFSPDSRGIEKIHLWTSGPNNGFQTAEGIELHEDPAPHTSTASLIFWQWRQLRQEAKALGCDVLVSMDSGTFASFSRHVVFAQDLLAYEGFERFRAGPPTKVLRQIVLRGLHKQSIRNASLSIFFSHYSLALFTTNLGTPRRSLVLEPRESGLDKKLIPRLEVEGGNLKVIYVSHVEPYKNHRNVLRAMPILRQMGINCDFQFVGAIRPSKEKNLTNTAKRIGEGSRVSFLGHMDREQVRQAIADSDIFLFASRAETLGFSLLEAIEAGKTVVCSAASAMPEVLGNRGVFFDPSNPVSIANSVRIVVENSELRSSLSSSMSRSLGRQSWKQIRNSFFSEMRDIAHERQDRV